VSYLIPDFTVNAALKAGADKVILFTFAIAMLGFLIIKRMIDPIIKISSDASKVADGDYDHKISRVLAEDEIGNLSQSLNKLALRIRENMDELRNYGERTREINLQINKRIITLSGLLQISDLISKGVMLNEILEAIVEKATQLGNSTLGFLCLKDRSTNEFSIKSVHGSKVFNFKRRGLDTIKIEPGRGLLGRLIKNHEMFILDRRTAITQEVKDFQDEFFMHNCIALPIFSRAQVIGILVIGNEQDNFVYDSSDLELMDIFSKQAAIAIENDFLSHRINKLEIKDALTGLYNESFIRNRLEEEIKRAVSFQRPCALILFDVDGFKEYCENFGIIESERLLKKIASILQEGITDIDKAARFAESAFAIVLPDKNKRQCLEIANDIKKKVELAFLKEDSPDKRITVSAAIAENPIDGVTADDLISKARNILSRGREAKVKNKILS
jgi:diguanylate cyclase (GGDEF)-like protein